MPTNVSMTQSGVDSPSIRWPWPSIALGVVLLAVFAVVFRDFLGRQVLWALRHEADWGHTLVVPFIAGYFVYHDRHRLLARAMRTSWSGLLLVALGLAWYALVSLTDALRNHNLQGLGVWITLVGLVVLLCGWRSMRVLWFPLVFLLVFGQSVSDRVMTLLTYRMQDIAARGSHVAFVLMGFDVERLGNTLHIFDGSGLPNKLNVAEACSGMRMLMAFLALGVVMAVLGLKRFWQRALLVILAVPTAIFVNVLRVVTLGLLSMLDPDFAAGNFHSFVGWVWLVPAVFIYFGLVWVIKRLVVEAPGPAAAPSGAPPPARVRPRFDRRAVPAAVLAVLTLAGGAIGFEAAARQLNVVLRKEPVPLRRHLTEIPRVLGPWESEREMRFDAAALEELGTDKYIDRVYVAREGEHEGTAVSVHVAYYTGMIDAVPHIPDRCFQAAGFMQTSAPRNYDLPATFPAAVVDESGPQRDGDPYVVLEIEHPLTGRDEIVRLPFGDLRIRVSRFVAENQMAVYGGFFFIANHRVTPNPAEIRALAFRLSEPKAYFTKVQFTMQVDPDDDPQLFLASSTDLLQHLLPQLMRCLPDWADVQSEEAEVTDVLVRSTRG